MGSRNLSKRHDGIGDLDDREAGMLGHGVQRFALDEHHATAALYSLGDEVVTV